MHVNMLAFIGGVLRQIVSDNLKSGITRACFYEPLANRTYADMYPKLTSSRTGQTFAGARELPESKRCGTKSRIFSGRRAAQPDDV